MMTVDDMGLVRKYAETGSDSAFAEIVSRYLNLVYSAALRQVREPVLAQEVTQAVFIVLAKKAASLGPGTVLSGWLYRTTGYVAANALQAEVRRQRREKEASVQSLLQNENSESVWRNLFPLLDEALARLRQTDRDALVLRYFENRSLQEVATVMGLQERAAQKRVMRSLEKVRTFFLKRGVNLSTAAIAGAVSANSVQAAPAALNVAAIVAAKNSAVASALPLADGALKTMLWTKIKISLGIGAGVATMLAGGYFASARFSSSGASIGEPCPAWIVSGAAALIKNGGPPSYRSHSEWIKVAFPGPVDFIQLPVQSLNPGRLDVSIAQDDNGLPGRVLEKFSGVLAPGIGATNPITLHSTIHPMVLKDARYWLCVEPADDTSAAVWFYSPYEPVVKTYAASSSPGGWLAVQPTAAASSAGSSYPNNIQRSVSYRPRIVVADK